jgi:hypothetical protein
LDRFG